MKTDFMKQFASNVEAGEISKGELDYIYDSLLKRASS